MCRVAVRKPPQPAAGTLTHRTAPGAVLESSPSLYEALQAFSSDHELENLDDVKFEEGEAELDDDFMALLHGMQAPETAPIVDVQAAQSQPATFVQTGQPVPQAQATPVDYTAQAVAAYASQTDYAVAAAAATGAPLGIPAPMQTAQAMYQPCGLPPVGFAYQQMLQQAYMHQQALHAPHGHQPATGGSTRTKRVKTQEEQAIQEEMIKRRRRESAQRSRQRKAVYLHALEIENKAPKLENERLRSQLTHAMSSGGALHAGPAAPVTGATGSCPISTTDSSELKLDVQTSDSIVKDTHAGVASFNPLGMMADEPMYVMGVPTMV